MLEILIVALKMVISALLRAIHIWHLLFLDMRIHPPNIIHIYLEHGRLNMKHINL